MFNRVATSGGASTRAIFNQIDSRLGTLEKRLDEAGIEELPDGIPDDECEQYFTLPLLGGPEEIRYTVAQGAGK